MYGRLLFVSLFSLAAADRLVTIVNRCPSAVNLYINGQSQGTLARNSATNRTYEDTWSGLIYTTANEGEANGAKTTRAGFYGQTNYYYIVKDAAHLNVGVSIVPRVLMSAATANFCSAATCDSVSCSSAYSDPPTSFPSPSGNAPAAPLHECPGANVGYTISFCPENTYPAPSGSVNIHPSGVSKKCVDVRGALITGGTAVQIYDCNGKSAQRWLFSRNGKSTAVQLAGTNYCLDAGSDPKSGSKLKISTCNSGSSAQTWVYSGNKIKVASANQCLDLTSGSSKNGNGLQTWTCQTASKNNQGWVTSS